MGSRPIVIAVPSLVLASRAATPTPQEANDAVLVLRKVSRQLPGFHEQYIRGQIASRPVEQLPGAHYFAEAFRTLDSAPAFPDGLRRLLDSFESWLGEERMAKRKRAK